MSRLRTKRVNRLAVHSHHERNAKKLQEIIASLEEEERYALAGFIKEHKKPLPSAIKETV